MNLETAAPASATRTCRQCRQAKPLDAFEPQRASCRRCRNAQMYQRKLELHGSSDRPPGRPSKSSRHSTEDRPEQGAALVLRNAGVKARSRLAQEAAARRNALHASIRHLPVGEAKAFIWSRMHAEREWRALTAVLPEPSGIHQLALDGGGFITVAELAKRHAEREEAVRAVKGLRRSPENVAAPLEIAQVPDAEPCDLDDEDAFRDAFGDWAPAWMSGAISQLAFA